jgi:hypothetical protein
MADATQARGSSAGRTTVVTVLTIIAILAIIAGIIYLAEPAKSLPSMFGTITHPASRANAHRSTRGWVAIVVGVIFLVAAGLGLRMGRSTAK